VSSRPGAVVLTCRIAPKARFYADALLAAGLKPERLRVAAAEGDGPVDSESLLDGASGLLLSGGGDLEPHLYGETLLAGAPTDTPSPARDRMELDLLAAARERRLPVLGICRGLQLANVAFGGTLWQDLPMQTGHSGHDYPASAGFALSHRAHAVSPNGSSGPMTEWIARAAARPVNSRHHQAIRDLAPGLRVEAEAPDGVIEAVSLPADDGWFWAVQWHPEDLVDEPEQRALFRSFLAAVDGSPS